MPIGPRKYTNAQISELTLIYVRNAEVVIPPSTCARALWRSQPERALRSAGLPSAVRSLPLQRKVVLKREARLEYDGLRARERWFSAIIDLQRCLRC